MPDDPDPRPFEDRSTGDLPGAAGNSSRGMFGGSSGSSHAEHEPPPERIGAYRILGAIGRGGMGTVYRAVREDDAGQRVVAIKLVRKGVDTEDVLKRFEHEGHILNALDHPNIARFFGSGQTDDGRPYFVMEHVEGMSITDHCDTQNLSIRRRLELFCKVCAAVHHAHTNLIVHRDLKPENILVTPAGEPKLLDFGIAKVLNPSLARAQVVTGPAIRLMTPEYASPEQVRGQPIRTVSDVYSLGVLLYELLCGHRPYQLPSRVEQEVIRVICETDPERPSTALRRVETQHTPDGGTREITPDTVAKHRDERVESLRRQISGDLDDIVLMAMHKLPDRRYESAEGMAKDITRHIRGEPVEARRAGARAVYVARKFVRRHKTGVIATAAALVMLAIGGSAAVWQWHDKVEAQLEQAQAKQDQLIQATFTNVLWENFGSRIVDISLPATQRQALWQEILNDFEDAAAAFGDDDPLVMAEFAKALSELGDVQGSPRGSNLGDSPGALASYERSYDLFEAALNQQPENPRLIAGAARARVYMGDILRDLDRSAQAIEQYKQAQATLDRLSTEDQKQLPFMRIRNAAALGQSQVALRICDLDTARNLSTSTLAARLETAQAHPQSNAAHRDVTTGHIHAGEVHTKLREFADAESQFRRALALRRATLEREPENPRYRRDVAVAQLYLGQAILDQARYDSALRELNTARDICETLVAEAPDDARARKTLIHVLNALSDAFQRSSDHTAALAAAADALQTLDWLDANTSEATVPRLRADALMLNGKAHLALNQFDVARAALEAALDLTEQQLALESARGSFLRKIITVCTALGDLEVAASAGNDKPNNEAAAWYTRALNTCKDKNICGLEPRLVDELTNKLRAAGGVP